MNKHDCVVNYTLSGLNFHSQHIVWVTADCTATDTVPAELVHFHSLNITVRTLPGGEGPNLHHSGVCPSSYHLTLSLLHSSLFPFTPLSSSPVLSKGSLPLLIRTLWTCIIHFNHSDNIVECNNCHFRRSHEKAESSSNPSLYEVPLDSNTCYAVTVLSIESSMFVAGQLARHSYATSNDSLSEEWEGSADYENVTKVNSMQNQ